MRMTRRSVIASLLTGSAMAATGLGTRSAVQAEHDQGICSQSYQRGYTTGKGALTYEQGKFDGMTLLKAEVEAAQSAASDVYGTGYVDGLQEGRAHAVRMSMPNAIVAGALYDFMGYLTTRPESFKIGSGESVYALMEHFTEWSEQRSLDPDIANVQGWQDALKHLV
jgi:hypothetical protein